MSETNENDDLWYALDNNRAENFVAEDVAEIVAEVPGENDELAWWWILRLHNGKHVLLSASCDYTGWDCRSGIDREEVLASAIECADNAPRKEQYSNRNIRSNLIAQLNGLSPKFLYDAAYELAEGE